MCAFHNRKDTTSPVPIVSRPLLLGNKEQKWLRSPLRTVHGVFYCFAKSDLQCIDKHLCAMIFRFSICHSLIGSSPFLFSWLLKWMQNRRVSISILQRTGKFCSSWMYALFFSSLIVAWRHFLRAWVRLLNNHSCDLISPIFFHYFFWRVILICAAFVLLGRLHSISAHFAVHFRFHSSASSHEYVHDNFTRLSPCCACAQVHAQRRSLHDYLWWGRKLLMIEWKTSGMEEWYFQCLQSHPGYDHRNQDEWLNWKGHKTARDSRNVNERKSWNDISVWKNSNWRFSKRLHDEGVAVRWSARSMRWLCQFRVLSIYFRTISFRAE